MTLDQALAKSQRFLTEIWLQSETAFLAHLADAGATERELQAARAQSRQVFAEELRTARAQVTAIWFSGNPGVH